MTWQQISELLYTKNLNDLEIREFFNGLWFSLAVCVVVVFGARLLSIWRKYSLREMIDDPESSAAAALFTFFVGETLYRGWIWLLLFYENMGWDNDWVEADFRIAILAGALSTWGALCCIKVFSRSTTALFVSALFVLTWALGELMVIVAR